VISHEDTATTDTQSISNFVILFDFIVLSELECYVKTE
jgi:hypothetical protein